MNLLTKLREFFMGEEEIKTKIVTRGFGPVIEARIMQYRNGTAMVYINEKAIYGISRSSVNRLVRLAVAYEKYANSCVMETENGEAMVTIIRSSKTIIV